DPAEAEALLHEALPIAESAQHPMLGPILTSLAQTHCRGDRQAEGHAFATRALAAEQASHGVDHWQTRAAVLSLNYCRALAGDTVDEAAVDQAIGAIVQRWGAESAFSMLAMRMRAE